MCVCTVCLSTDQSYLFIHVSYLLVYIRYYLPVPGAPVWLSVSSNPSTCLSVGLLTYIYIYMYVSPFGWLSRNQSIYTYSFVTNLVPTYIHTCLPTFLPTCLPTYLSTYWLLPVHQVVYLRISQTRLLVPLPNC